MVDRGPAPRRGRPPVSDEQRRRQRLAISRHAVRLFSEQGLAATSGEQIARASGVSERTLWRHFPHKESCVEPLLTKTIDAFRTVLHAWPPDVDLAEHLRSAYQPVLNSPSATDVEAVLAVIRLTHDEPALRAAYLVLRERAEDTLAEVLSARTGVPSDALPVRVEAAAMNAALKVATDDLIHETAESGITPDALLRHREHLADAISFVTRRAPGDGRD
ncbi:TetR family transcriptional regulator [Streptomyces tuirus]|uniref:TetR family transcriptional regulator n=1 Tax=Streptomyces tuirus TaxID=68278 RepID=A0A941J3A7_9ACTN|nr:TetR family transcriptional regulator [Streptomyces tuirus]